MDIHKIQDEIHAISKSKGWHDGIPERKRTFGDVVALAHSEVSEAFIAYQNGNYADEHGVLEELGDVVIRLLDTMKFYGFKSNYEIYKKRKDLKTGFGSFTIPYCLCRIHKKLSNALEFYRLTKGDFFFDCPDFEDWGRAINELDYALTLSISLMQELIDYYIVGGKTTPESVI